MYCIEILLLDFGRHHPRSAVSPLNQRFRMSVTGMTLRRYPISTGRQDLFDNFTDPAGLNHALPAEAGINPLQPPRMVNV
jgi:hypothetical protein